VVEHVGIQVNHERVQIPNYVANRDSSNSATVTRLSIIFNFLVK